MSAQPNLPVGALAALAAHVLDGGTLDDVLRHVCEVAIEVLGAADEASVTLLTDREATTYGATGPMALAADEAQYRFGGGPCLDSARANQLVSVPELPTDDRWAATTEMTEVGARSSLSLPLPVQGEAIGALNVYARVTHAFDDDAVALGREFASYGAVAVANAVSYSSAADAARNLRAAMEHRAVIEQAKGILIGSTGCDEDEAFHLLVQQSQHENRKLREIAAELVKMSIRKSAGP
jgi:GAF domain-containing protein